MIVSRGITEPAADRDQAADKRASSPSSIETQRSTSLAPSLC